MFGNWQGESITFNKELAWIGKGFLNDVDEAYLLLQSQRYLTGYQSYVLQYEMVSLAML